MFCQKCGKEVRSGAKYCPHCGAAVSVQMELRTKEKSKKEKSKLVIALRIALMVCAVVVPWFEFDYYIGSMSFNLFSLGVAIAEGTRTLQSIASMSGATADTSSLATFALFWIVLSLVPLVYLALDIRAYLKKGQLRVEGPAAIAIMLALGLAASMFIPAAFGASISDALSSSVQLGTVSVSAGWWITLGLVVVTIWVNRLVRAGKCSY